VTVVSQRRGRAGWSERETNMLWDEVKTAGSSGLPLRNVFETVAHSTGRKPNSVRNYYYTNMKTGTTPPEIASLRVLPFMPFREGEAENLLRSVLTARSRGESVRACVLKLANGDRSLMLRYQNKYRALLRTIRRSPPVTVTRPSATSSMAFVGRSARSILQSPLSDLAASRLAALAAPTTSSVIRNALMLMRQAIASAIGAISAVEMMLPGPIMLMTLVSRKMMSGM